MKLKELKVKGNNVKKFAKQLTNIEKLTETARRAGYSLFM